MSAPVQLNRHHRLDAPTFAPPHGCTFCGHLEADHGTHAFRGHTEPACGAQIAIGTGIKSYGTPEWAPGKCGCVEFDQ